MYVANTTNPDTKSPIKVELEKEVKVSVINTFSNNYYTERGRDMRDATNLVVNTYHTDDIVQDGLTFKLKYVIFRDKRYSVESILNYYLDYKKSQFKKILDLRETL